VTGYFYNDTVHVLRPGTTTNRAQETVLNYAGLEEAAGYPRALVQIRPVTSDELSDVDRVAGVEEWLLQTKPGSGDWDVRATDWIRLPDGRIVTVHGPALRPTRPEDGKLDHVQIRARRVAGAA
jgi:hypothetical protein